ncbi:MAG: T9SS type A sorting domain-containing protein [Bacteroidia bacterium]|nr:PQQ-dependent sugar dehydrogenase [Bacteroidia bacterium]NNM15467.1 T9SS type A sorting domain-containing protein [Bacteroidia bacterium]
MDSNYTTLATPFIDIDSRVRSVGNEQGLLGLAFHPNYATNGYFYVNYTDNNGDTRISRFSVNSGNANLGDPNSELNLLTIAQPATNHNAGDLAFGPDGYLYFGLGDGGSGGDPWNNSQNTQELLGKIIRIDVDSGATYSIPPTNPFINDSTILDEIYAIGIRNPWRIAFDQLTGDLWIADVGQNAWEEVDVIPWGSNGGQNFGWRCYEGDHSYNTTGCNAQSTYDSPVYEYGHATGNSLTGGFVYRGTDFRDMQGHYLLADYGSGFVSTVYVDGAGVYQNTTQSVGLGSVSTFGEDENAEMYVARLNGSIYRVKDECEELRPAIALNGNNLSSTFNPTPPLGTTYQWLFNGFPIPGATTNAYSITTSGTYSLQVAGTNSCLVESDTLYAVFTGIYEEAPKNEVQIFPNPFYETTSITFTEYGDYDVFLYDIEGKLIESKTIRNGKQVQIERNKLVVGTYLLSVKGDIEYHSLLIVK